MGLQCKWSRAHNPRNKHPDISLIRWEEGGCFFFFFPFPPICESQELFRIKTQGARLRCCYHGDAAIRVNKVPIIAFEYFQVVWKDCHILQPWLSLKTQQWHLDDFRCKALSNLNITIIADLFCRHAITMDHFHWPLLDCNVSVHLCNEMVLSRLKKMSEEWMMSSLAQYQPE